MNCIVCILLLRALRRGGGDGGESEDDLREMTSSGSGPQFLSGGRGRLGVRGEEEGRFGHAMWKDKGRGPPEGARVSGRSCHGAFMRTCRKDIEKYTHLYWVLIMSWNDLHVSRRRGGRTLIKLRMYARTR